MISKDGCIFSSSVEIFLLLSFFFYAPPVLANAISMSYSGY